MDVLSKVTQKSKRAREIIKEKGAFYLVENYCPADFIDTDMSICDLFDINLKDDICPKCWIKEV